MCTKPSCAALAVIEPAFTEAEKLALAGFLAGYSGMTREAYTLDLRQFTAWCRQRQLHLFAARRADIAIGPLPRGGSSDTVAATTYLPDFAQASGATFRLVIDVGGWDNSVVMNSPGQSGDPASPHYADLFPLWAADGAVPLLYSRDRIEAVAQERIRLVPRESA